MTSINVFHFQDVNGKKEGGGERHSEILEFSIRNEKWTRVGNMSRPRAYSAISIVNFDDYKPYCR